MCVSQIKNKFVRRSVLIVVFPFIVLLLPFYYGGAAFCAAVAGCASEAIPAFVGAWKGQ